MDECGRWLIWTIHTPTRDKALTCEPRSELMTRFSANIELTKIATAKTTRSDGSDHLVRAELGSRRKVAYKDFQRSHQEGDITPGQKQEARCGDVFRVRSELFSGRGVMWGLVIPVRSD
ncbi:uncharacterized protein J3R85_001479 [Psidium guajava]|nr:uncharacterized protein J3R85_001479 [Psidium guajava]